MEFKTTQSRAMAPECFLSTWSDVMKWSLYVCVFFHSADYVFFENSSSNPYLIRRIEELNKVTTRSVPVVFLCVSSTWCLRANSRDSSAGYQPLPLFVTRCVCAHLVIKRVMYERDRCSTVSTLLFISNGTPVRVHVWEETIIATDGARTQPGAFTILFYFFPQIVFISFLFFSFYSVFLSFPHRLYAARGHCAHVDVSSRDFVDRISTRNSPSETARLSIWGWVASFMVFLPSLPVSRAATLTCVWKGMKVFVTFLCLPTTEFQSNDI